MTIRIEDLQTIMDDKLRELEKFRLEYAEKLKVDFQKVTDSMFTDTGIQAIAWTQYTPYFNDGDECVFSVNEPTFILGGFDPDEEVDSVYDYEDDEKYELYAYFSDWTRESYKKEIESGDPGLWAQAAYDRITKQDEKYGHIHALYESFYKIMITHSDLMKYIYGDHVQIVLSKNRTEVLEFDHD
jgi:hypothetical protein